MAEADVDTYVSEMLGAAEEKLREIRRKEVGEQVASVEENNGRKGDEDYAREADARRLARLKIRREEEHKRREKEKEEKERRVRERRRELEEKAAREKERKEQEERRRLQREARYEAEREREAERRRAYEREAESEREAKRKRELREEEAWPRSKQPRREGGSSVSKEAEKPQLQDDKNLDEVALELLLKEGQELAAKSRPRSEVERSGSLDPPIRKSLPPKSIVPRDPVAEKLAKLDKVASIKAETDESRRRSSLNTVTREARVPSATKARDTERTRGTSRSPHGIRTDRRGSDVRVPAKDDGHRNLDSPRDRHRDPKRRGDGDDQQRPSRPAPEPGTERKTIKTDLTDTSHSRTQGDADAKRALRRDSPSAHVPSPIRPAEDDHRGRHRRDERKHRSRSRSASRHAKHRMRSPYRGEHRERSRSPRRRRSRSRDLKDIDRYVPGPKAGREADRPRGENYRSRDTRRRSSIGSDHLRDRDEKHSVIDRYVPSHVGGRDGEAGRGKERDVERARDKDRERERERDRERDRDKNRAKIRERDRERDRDRDRERESDRRARRARSRSRSRGSRRYD